MGKWINIQSVDESFNSEMNVLNLISFTCFEKHWTFIPCTKATKFSPDKWRSLWPIWRRNAAECHGCRECNSAISLIIVRRYQVVPVADNLLSSGRRLWAKVGGAKWSSLKDWRRLKDEAWSSFQRLIVQRYLYLRRMSFGGVVRVGDYGEVGKC